MIGQKLVFKIAYLLSIAWTAILLWFAATAYQYDGYVTLWFQKYNENLLEIVVFSAFLILLIIYLYPFWKFVKSK